MATGEDFHSQLPPQNLDAERSVLGSMLLSNDAVDEVASFLKATHFYLDAHQRIYADDLPHARPGTRRDRPVTLAEELGREKLLEETGGPATCTKSWKRCRTRRHVRYYADIVHEKYVQRTLIDTCTEVLRSCYDSSRRADEILQRGRAEDLLDPRTARAATRSFRSAISCWRPFRGSAIRMQKPGRRQRPGHHLRPTSTISPRASNRPS